MIRPVIAVDLAARYSAVVALTPSGQVAFQFDSLGKTTREFVDEVVTVMTTLNDLDQLEEDPILVVEDLPPHVPSSTVAKTVAQLQGRIIQALPEIFLEDLYFVPPAHWEREMGVFRKELPFWESKAGELGYRPPDLLADRGLVPGTRGQATAVKEAIKQRTDYVAAYLLARWAQDCMAQDKNWDLHVIKQYRS